MTEATATPAADAAPAAAPAAAPTPRAPKLMVSIAGAAAIALLKYPFPVKAPTFFVKVNGKEAVAAVTGGRGKSYTYFKVEGTSFYVPGAYPADTEFSVNFPEGYVFDNTGDRKSYYKPKKAAAAGDAPTPAAAGQVGADTKEGDPFHGVSPNQPSTAPEVEVPPPAPKASRRQK
jgi:hypothetical protein